MKQLEDKLARYREAETPEKSHQEEHYSQAQLAWRMVTELVAGLGLGCGIGYGLDVLFGTKPWLLVIFTLLGFAAGVQTMMRTAAEVQVTNKASKDAANEGPDGSEG